MGRVAAWSRSDETVGGISLWKREPLQHGVCFSAYLLSFTETRLGLDTLGVCVIIAKENSK